MHIKDVAFTANAATIILATALWHACCRSAPAVGKVISAFPRGELVLLDSKLAQCKPGEPWRLPGEEGRGEVHIVAEWLGPVVAASPGVGSRQDGGAGVEGGLHIKPSEILNPQP